MDGRGRLAQSLTGSGPLANPVDRRRTARRAATSRALAPLRVQPAGRFERFVARYARVLEGCKLTRGGGVAASILIILSAIAYGVIRGGHADAVAGAFHDLRDAAGGARLLARGRARPPLVLGRPHAVEPGVERRHAVDAAAALAAVRPRGHG